MATYNLNVTASVDLLGSDISGSQSTDFAIANPLSGSSYFTFETVRNSDGFYDSSSPKNMAGTYTLGAGLAGVVKSDYIASVVVEPGGGTLTFVPTNYISGSSLNLRGTSAPPPDLDAANFLAAAGITGAVESAAITTLVADLKVAGIWSKMKAVYPFVTDNRNLLSYTEDFGNGVWLRANITVPTNTTTAPNGTLTADTLEEDNTLNYHYTRQIPPTLSSNNVVASCFFKKNTGRYVRLILSSGNSSVWVAAQFDLDTLTFTSGEGTNATGAFVNASITEENNGFYRCQIAINLSGVTNFWISLSDGSALLSTDDFGRAYYQGTNKSVYIWGAQLENGSTATAYQPIATTQQSYISNQFKYNLKDPRDLDAAFRLVFNGGWTHSSTGATPNGTNGYADTKLVPSSVLAQNNASIGVYSRTNTSGQFTDCGAYDTTGIWLRTRRLNDTGGGYVNASDQYTSNTSSLGLFSLSRISSSSFSFYKNGTATSFTSTSTGIPAINIYIGAGNLTNSPYEYSPRQVAFTHIGDGLNDTEASNLYTAVQAFQTSLSRQV